MVSIHKKFFEMLFSFGGGTAGFLRETAVRQMDRDKMTSQIERPFTLIMFLFILWVVESQELFCQVWFGGVDLISH